MKKQFLLLALAVQAFFFVQAQHDLLAELNEDSKEISFDYPAFKAMKIGNLQSTKVAQRGDLYMYVSHRFGTLKDGIHTFFGFDNANTKIQLVYGLFDGIQIGISRESLRKTYASSIKATLIKQKKSFPLNVVAYSTLNYNTSLEASRYPLLEDRDRLSYATQLLVSHRFNRQLSLELAPTYIRQNLVLEPSQKHNQMAFGVGGRYKLSKRTSLNVDYVQHLNRTSNSIYQNPLTIGFDIETGGHVFQLLFSNAQSTNEVGFISNAEGNWSDGDIFFGFNIVRVF